MSCLSFNPIRYYIENDTLEKNLKSIRFEKVLHDRQAVASFSFSVCYLGFRATNNLLWKGVCLLGAGISSYIFVRSQSSIEDRRNKEEEERKEKLVFKTSLRKNYQVISQKEYKIFFPTIFSLDKNPQETLKKIEVIKRVVIDRCGKRNKEYLIKFELSQTGDPFARLDLDRGAIRFSLEFIQKHSEIALKGVMHHEISHLLGEESYYNSKIQVSENQDDEIEADEEAAKYMSGEECLAMADSLMKYHNNNNNDLLLFQEGLYHYLDPHPPSFVRSEYFKHIG